MAEKYGTAEQATLLVLMLEKTGEMPNPDLRHDHGISLDPSGRKKLNEAGLLETRKVGGRFVHRITIAGQDWCEKALGAIEPPSKSSALARVGFDVLRLLVAHARRSGVRLVDLLHSDTGEEPTDPDDLESLILEAYGELRSKPREPISLVKLRNRLDGADKKEVDQTLVAMMKTGRVVLTPDSNRRGLTAEDHDAAIRIGREDKHFVVIGES